MALEIFDATNTYARITKPSARVTKSGVIAFSVSAIEKLNLSKGDKIAFVRDGKDWYIMRSEKGIELKPKGGNGQWIGIASQPIAQKIRDTLGYTDRKNFTVLMATQPEQKDGHMMYAMLLSSVTK